MPWADAPSRATDPGLSSTTRQAPGVSEQRLAAAAVLRAGQAKEEDDMAGFAVEANRSVVGVAVRVRGGYRFFCSDQQFRALDGRLFRRVKTLARCVARFAEERRNKDCGKEKR